MRPNKRARAPVPFHRIEKRSKVFHVNHPTPPSARSEISLPHSVNTRTLCRHGKAKSNSAPLNHRSDHNVQVLSDDVQTFHVKHRQHFPSEQMPLLRWNCDKPKNCSAEGKGRCRAHRELQTFCSWSERRYRLAGEARAAKSEPQA